MKVTDSCPDVVLTEHAAVALEICSRFISTAVESVLQNETSRPILAIQADFLLLQHAEGFAREIFAVDFFGIENIAQFVAGETVETGVVGIQFGAELGAATVFQPHF